MRILMVIIAMVTLSTLPSKAQDYLFSLSYNTAAPLGELKDYVGKYSWRGISAEPRWFLNSGVSVGAFFGWNVFYEKLYGSFVDDTRTLTGTQARYVNAFPILVDGHYYLGEPYDIRPYVGLGLGTYRTRQRTEMGIFAVDNNNWHFGLSPSVGVLIPVGYADSALHLGIRYHKAFKTSDSLDFSYLGINLGFAWLN